MASERKYGIVRRIAVGILAVLLIAFTGWNVADGVIYLRGGGIARADHPLLFWLIAAMLISLALLLLHWAMFRAGTGKPTL